ncbi:MAG TPA: polar amino acid ABC transporter permease, partial [Limnochordia bacterium]|nr:polar amino acid ABC transporter permease [Limnochordia bacterium]
MASTQASKRPEPAGPGAIPFWRHRGVRNIAIQAVFLAAVFAVIAYFYNNMIRGLNELGLTFGYRFLRLEAGFAISEGIAYQPSDTYARALLVGIVNTVKVTLAGIVAASLIGLVVGVASLSSNWLVRS